MSLLVFVPFQWNCGSVMIQEISDHVNNELTLSISIHIFIFANTGFKQLITKLSQNCQRFLQFNIFICIKSCAIWDQPYLFGTNDLLNWVELSRYVSQSLKGTKDILFLFYFSHFHLMFLTLILHIIFCVLTFCYQFRLDCHFFFTSENWFILDFLCICNQVYLLPQPETICKLI